MQIYLDYSATTPCCDQALFTLEEVLRQQWGNPSSLHYWGQRSAEVLEVARCQVASLLQAPNPDTIVFTAGGTEANNLALMGIAQHWSKPQHLIISSVEHAAIAEPAKFLEQQGWQITYLPVNHRGRINPLELKAAIQDNTRLISVIYGQSEVGTIQPIEALGNIARAHNIPFHTDAVQVAGRIPLNVQQLPVDLLSLSSHKLYGPQGAGALYVRPGVKLQSWLKGGGQEGGLRSGTQALPAIAGFGVAAELAAAELDSEAPRLFGLRERLFDQLADCPYLQTTGDRLYRLPHHASFIVVDPQANQRQENINGKILVRQLNLAGIGISAGSACHSGKLSPSPILLAMGYNNTQALAGIRLTLGRQTQAADIDWTAMVLRQLLERLLPPLAASTRGQV